jgi:Ulp1 family protease
MIYNSQSFTANRRPLTDTGIMDAVEGSSVIGCGDCGIIGMNDAKAENTSDAHDTPLTKTDSESTPESFDDMTQSDGKDQLAAHTATTSENETKIRNDLQSTIFDGKTFSELLRGYDRHSQTMQRDRITIPSRRWLDSVAVRAAGATLTDRVRKYWLGPTRGDTAMDRAKHRNQKTHITSAVFKYTLSYITQSNIGTADQRTMGIIDTLTGTRTLRVGGGRETEVSLFSQYIARVEQLSREEVAGYTRYVPKHRTEFDKMSRKRQMLELGKLGIAIDSLDSANKLFVRDDNQYPSTYTSYEVPRIHPPTLSTADILHHHYHITNKVVRLRKLRRESKREATLALRKRRRTQESRLNGREWSIGSQRARNIYLINRSIVEHNRLIQQLEEQLRKRGQQHNKALDTRYVGAADDMSSITGPTDRPIQRTRNTRGCRHHTKPDVVTTASRKDNTTEAMAEKPTFLQELRRRRLRKWETRSEKICYRSAHDRVGGYVSDQCEALYSDTGNIKVCTMNIRGFDDNDNKLELILQFIQDEDIDVMLCIDAQLDVKKGHWYGKIAKRRLGVGTCTNVNPCMVVQGGNTGTKHRVGGIFTIVSPKWGTSIVNFQKDKFGIDESSAGVMTQVTLATATAKLNIIGTYWPNRNVTTDSTLWNTLNTYVRKHRLRDNNPIALLQRVSQQWIATAYKNGSRGSILCGDLNATWTGIEAGGQTVLQQWAESFSLHSGVRQVAQRLKCEIYTRGGDGQPRTWIDHVLHKGATENIQCLAGYTSQAAEWVGISDHKPIWGIYKVQPPLQKCPKSGKVQKVRYELQLTDSQKCDEFTEAMESLLDIPVPTDDSTDEEVIAYMHKLEQHSATTVKHLHNTHGQTSKRSSRKDGWSPMYIAYKAHLTTLVEIRRSLLGHAHRKKWSDTMTMMREMPDILDMWETTLDSLDITSVQRQEIMDSTAHSLQWWKDLTTLPDIGAIDNDIDTLKQRLHGVSRIEFRRRINVHVRRREDARREGKWKKVIGSLLGNLAGRRHQPGIDLDMITTDDGKILGDPEEIHQAVTDKFEEWFDMPDTCHGDLHIGNNWTQCRDSEEYFVRDTAHTGTPENIRRLIHKAIVNVPNQKQIHDELRESLKQPPSLIEFEDAIKKAKTNSSAGISGCSYNQLKRWPPELIARVHYCLCRIWQSQCTPDRWTARWLVVIPKKQEDIPNVSNMRPLILVEAIRKIWCKLLLHRILTVWGKHNTLHRYQHGFIRGRNTMTASTLFINTLEDAIEKGQPLHTCTWDITKAFDSVSKNVMKLAWTRLGVPDDWVRWLVGMDEKGTTTVRTPHAIDIWNKHGASGLSRRSRQRKKHSHNVYDKFRCPGTVPRQDTEDDQQEATGPGFHAVRGTGQGDVTSPTCWAAIFDILLTALHMDIQHTRMGQHVSSESNLGYAEGETAYADDLLSCARTPEALQRKADIVSTFCLIMGLQLSTSKLRRFVMAHSGLAEEDNTTIVHQYGSRETIDGPEWESSTIQASLDGTLEYLGGKYDTDGKARTVLDEIKQTASSHCAEIGNTAASAVTKLRCSSMTTYAKIRYRSKLASTYLTELDEVDRIFYKFHTKTTKNMGSFPYDLLYQSPKYGGVGLQRFTDLNSMDKLSEMFRSIQRTDEVRSAMGGMLQRMARAQGHAIPHGYKYRYTAKRGQRFWLRSALEWLQRHNIHLWRGGIQPNVHLLSSPINIAIPGLSIQQQRILLGKGICHIGDIIDDRAGTRTWSVPASMGWLLACLPDTPTLDCGTLLWPGQFWQPYANSEGVRPANVLEVVHVLDEQHVEVTIWRQSDRRGNIIDFTKDPKNVVVTISAMFGGTHTERWDQKSLRGLTCSFHRPRLVPSPRATVQLPTTPVPWLQQAAQFCQEQGPEYKPRIYTDGSYMERDHDIHSVFDSDAITKTAAAGIAIIHDGPDWRDRPIYAIHVDHGADIGVRSAYTMEYLALAIAMRLQTPSMRASAVCTDSMAVLKRLRNGHTRLGRADESHRLLLQSIKSSLDCGATMPQWVPSHPERRKKDKATWTLDDWGNHIADNIAGNARRSLSSIHANIQWTRISAIDVINSLPRSDELYFGDINGRPTALYGLMDHVHRLRLERYLSTRDSQRGSVPKWMDNTITFAAAVFNAQHGTPGQYAHTARVIWDKHWHGRNRAKQRGLTEDGRQAETLCHMCHASDSQHHSFRWCTHSNVRAIREETIEALGNYERLHRDLRAEDGTAEEHRIQLAFIKGIIHEFHTCSDAGRAWTGNWSSGMIARLQTCTQVEHITKKQCRRLRTVLHELYAIIAQGANDINDIRHGVGEAQDASNRRAQNTQTSGTHTGQRLITDYFYNSRGHTGLEEQILQETTLEDAKADDEMNISVQSDNSLANNEHWQSDQVSDDSHQWLRYPQADECLALSTAIHNAAHPQQCLNTVGKHSVRAYSLKQLITGNAVDAAIVDGYLHTLQERTPGLKCMGSSFFTKLFNPGGHIKHMPRDTFNMGYASHHFNKIDITQYRRIFIPVLVKRHWTLIIVDMDAKQIRYLNSHGGGGSTYLTVIKRWLVQCWGNQQTNDLNFDNWRCLSASEAFTPQQTDESSCGIFLLMFSELLAGGRDVTLFSETLGHKARMHVANSLLNFPARHRGHEDLTRPSKAHIGTLSDVLTCEHKKKKRKTRAPTVLQADPYINVAEHVAMDDRGVDATVLDNRADTGELESLAPNGWLTDSVINSYFQLLQQRSAAQGTNNAFLSAHFYNRLYDPSTEAIRLHLQQCTEPVRNSHGLSELDELRAMHQFDAIFNYSHVYIPVPLAQHWTLLEVDNCTRTITFMDSYKDGGYHYARIMRTYLLDYEEEIKGTRGPEWTLRHTMNPNNKLITPRLIHVPRQQNGNDCGVYVCLFADLLDRQQEIMRHREPDILQIRERIRCSIATQVALDLTTQDTGPPSGIAEPMSQDNEVEPTVTVGTDSTPTTAIDSQSNRRRSTRSTRHTGSLADMETPTDINYHRLAVRRAHGMGWGLFATADFSHAERVICTYYGKRLTARQAKSKTNKSRYIVELPGKTKYNYIDGYDSLTQQCYSAGPYANDGINWTGRRDLWNAELTIDDYNPDLFVLRPLRDIRAGEQIYVWYGPRYWCSDDHTVDQMAMAVMTYGIDIAASTEKSSSYGNWKKLKQYHSLKEVLRQRGYVPPPTMADIKNIRDIPKELHGSIQDTTDEELDLRTLPKLQSGRSAKPASNPTLEATSTDTAVHSDEVCGDDELLPPSPEFTKISMPRFRVGSNPIAHRKALLLNRGKNRVSLQVNRIPGSHLRKRGHSQVADVATPVPDTLSKRQRVEDSNITAPDAIEDALESSQATQTYVNTNGPNISSAKRTSTQAMLPESYWSKRPKMDSRSS